ncbi:MAG: beta-propeller fold lactonase family protein [Chlamydiales bacterium]|nr:beta-propeller fold lactonase family protein [Chlamydiales bacterium]
MINTNIMSSIFVFLLISVRLFSLSISRQPVCEMSTPNSLYSSNTFQSFYVGSQQRFSTCSGVAWAPDQEYLATVNFEAGAICLYKFNQKTSQCSLFQVVYGGKAATLYSGENLSFSPDGALLAVSVNHSRAINIYKVNSKTHHIDTNPTTVIISKNPNVHGVRFSNQTNYLALTTVRGDSAVALYKRKKRNNKTEFDFISELKSEFAPLKAKSIDFTKDDNYAAVIYAVNVTKTPSSPDGLIAIYKFDRERGILGPEPTFIYHNPEEFNGGEDIRFYKDDSCIFVSDHVHHKIRVYAFDKENGTIGEKVFEIENPDARLSFPHGIGLSPDGKYIGVANYGNDNFSIYKITPP